MLRKAMDMKPAARFQISNIQLREKPGEKKDLFLFLVFFLIDVDKFSPVREARG